MIRSISFLVLTWLITVAGSANAEDIDLFKGGGAQDPSPPNVLLIIDNTSNWSAQNQAWKKTEVKSNCKSDPVCEGYVEQIFTSATLSQGQVEAAALRLVLNELYCNNSSPAKVNIGLMLINTSAYTSNTGSTSTSGGSNSWSGYVRRAVLPMGTSRCSALITDLNSMVNDLKPWKWPRAPITGGCFSRHSNITVATPNPEISVQEPHRPSRRGHPSAMSALDQNALVVPMNSKNPRPFPMPAAPPRRPVARHRPPAQRPINRRP